MVLFYWPQDISYNLSSDPDFIFILDNWKLSLFTIESIIEYFPYNTDNSMYNMENNV